MLDRAISGYVPEILNEKPELNSLFSGFKYYPNCASFASHTIIGAPPLYGGYEYTPLAINERDTETMSQKHKEAYLMLPTLFSNNDFLVKHTDPVDVSLTNTSLSSILEEYPEFNSEIIRRKYTSIWQKRNPNVSGVTISAILTNNLLRFSLFKFSPIMFRLFFYDGGNWLTTFRVNKNLSMEGILTPNTIDDYALLDLLPELTKIKNEETNNISFIYSLLAHNNSFLQAPDYIPSQEVTNKGDGLYFNEIPYHLNMATFLLLGKYFLFLKDNEVYDNTRIIIVADHGTNGVLKNNPDNFSLTITGGSRSVSTFNPLLMFKDFNNDGSLIIDNSFMTNADAPLLAIDGIINEKINPFTNKPLLSDKDKGIFVYTTDGRTRHGHSKYKYHVGKNYYHFVKDNIFIKENWVPIE